MINSQKIGLGLLLIATIMLIVAFFLFPIEKENKQKEIALRVGISACLTCSWFLTGYAIGMLLR